LPTIPFGCAVRAPAPAKEKKHSRLAGRRNPESCRAEGVSFDGAIVEKDVTDKMHTKDVKMVEDIAKYLQVGILGIAVLAAAAVLFCFGSAIDRITETLQSFGG